MKHHILIAGTGRSGTTLLVKLLEELGLETKSETKGNHYSEQANAGNESFPLLSNAPYICKSPWLYEYYEEVLNKKDIVVDAIILPIRDLDECTLSRFRQDYLSIYNTEETTEHFGKKDPINSVNKFPGGNHFELDYQHQKKFLALNFFEIYQKSLEHQIPIIPLLFPKFVTDFEYFHENLQLLFKIRDSKAPPKKEIYKAFTKIVDTKKVTIKKADTPPPKTKNEELLYKEIFQKRAISRSSRK